MSSELRVDKIIPTAGVPTGGGGGIVQVKQITHSGYIKYNTNSFAAGTKADSSTGDYSITITPTRADSKILVSFESMYDSYQNQRTFVTLYRTVAGGTATHVLGDNVGAARGMCEIWQNSTRIQAHCSGQFLDEPSTTNAVTYTVYANTSTGDFYLGLYDNIKFMHAMEVSA